MRFPTRKKPVRKEDLLTNEEMEIIKLQKSWPVDKMVLWLCGVRKPWPDDEYPPYGPPGKPTYKQVLAIVHEAIRNGELKTHSKPL